jgi:Tfp pilus assembly protein PilO
MEMKRQKALLRWVEIAAVFLIAADIVLYVAVVHPLKSSAESEQQESDSLRQQVRAEQARLAALEKSQADLPATDTQIQDFFSKHVPSRRKGFSRAAALVRELTQKSGVQLTAVGYRLDSTHKQVLDRLGIEMEVTGAFPDLLRFTHALETADDFVLVRGLSFEPAEEGGLALRIAADLYMTR